MDASLYFSYRVFQLMEKAFMETPKKQSKKKNNPFFPYPK